MAAHKNTKTILRLIHVLLAIAECDDATVAERLDAAKELRTVLAARPKVRGRKERELEAALGVKS